MLPPPLRSLRILAVAAFLSMVLAGSGCAQMRGSGDEASRSRTEQAGKSTRQASRQQASPARSRQVTPQPSIATDPAAAAQRIATATEDDAGITATQVGYYMDVHEARLRQAIAGTPVSLGRDSEHLLLIIPGKTTFRSGSARLMHDVDPILDSIAQVLVEFDKTLVTVQAHTDDRGDADFNRKLSERRALAVAGYLRDLGIDTQRLVAVGMGETQPAGSNATPQGRAANRRVEIIVQPFVESENISN